MANTDRTTTHALIERELRENLSQVGFFYALRAFECLHSDLPRLGTANRAQEELLRLTQQLTMEFAPATLAKFEDQQRRLSVHFLGLFGPQGALPLHLTEYVRERLRENDQTFLRFCDVFHHRMLALFYRSWANSDPTVSFDRPAQDRFGDYLASLIGLGLPALRQRDAFPDEAKLYFTSHLSGQTRHPQGLRVMLMEFFGVPAHIHEFVGEWMDIASEDQTQLGISPRTGRLGISAMLGARVWGCQGKFRILLGPLDLQRYQDFLSGGKSLGKLGALVKNYVGDELSWDINLILLKEQVPQLCCDGSARLGWTSWMGKRASQRNANDLCFNPLAFHHQ